MLLAPMKPAVPPLLHLDHVGTAAALSLHYGGMPSSVSMPPTKRPKLSLQTTSLPTSYGTSSSTTSNKAEAMSANTPTTLNTFNNTFDLTIRQSPNSATASPSIVKRTKSNSATPFRRKPTYDLKLPLGIRPILKSSKHFHETRRGSMTTSASPRTTRRVFFPPAKKVSFLPVDEEIVTNIYVARHFDITSSEDESNTDYSCEAEVASQSHDADHDTQSHTATHDKQDDSIEEGRGRQSVGHLSSTHRSKRKKRRWEWTIESLDKTEGETHVKAQKNSDVKQEELSTPPSMISAADIQAETGGDSSLEEFGCPAGLVETSHDNTSASLAMAMPGKDPPISP